MSVCDTEKSVDEMDARERARYIDALTPKGGLYTEVQARGASAIEQFVARIARPVVAAAPSPVTPRGIGATSLSVLQSTESIVFPKHKGHSARMGRTIFGPGQIGRSD